LRGHLRRGVWRKPAGAGGLAGAQASRRRPLGAVWDAAASASGHWLCYKSHMEPRPGAAHASRALSAVLYARFEQRYHAAAASSVAESPSATGIYWHLLLASAAGTPTGNGGTGRTDVPGDYEARQPACAPSRVPSSLLRRVATPALLRASVCRNRLGWGGCSHVPYCG
jgi:hypothetical protein